MVRPLVVSLLALAVLAPAPASALPDACAPAGARLVEGQIVRWHDDWWFCATQPRRLVALPVPSKTTAIAHSVARGRYLAFAYDVGRRACDHDAPGAMSVDRRTGAVRYALAPYDGCYDVFAWYISDLALRDDTGGFGVIRGMADLEDDMGYAMVIRVNAAGKKVLDKQDDRGSDERLSPERIVGDSLTWSDGRLRWRRVSGPRSAAL